MWLTVPCFDEASRLDVREVDRLLEDARIDVLFVNDGSRDGTGPLLDQIASERPGRVNVLHLPENRGKSEAVRRGMLEALAMGSPVVGYLDADFATPPAEMSRLVDVLEQGKAKVVMGARIARLGAVIDRRAARHYLGRVFATVASNVLDLVVYDTQCGAKLFRDTPALREALAEPFRSRWAFDVELIGRLTAAREPLQAEDFLEMPLTEWRDKRGSKLAAPAMWKAGADVLALGALVAVRGKRGFFP